MKAKRVFGPRTSFLMVFSVAMLVTFAWSGLSGNIAIAEAPPIPDPCGNNDEFTKDFRLEDCRWFKSIGINPYFKLIPGYKLVLETPEDAEERERAEITVLRDVKWINLGDRWIRTRVVEERAYEWDKVEEEWVLIEISRNWFAICKKTNAVYYFGEDSRDCEDGFDENDDCEGGADITGSWEAGVNDAQPGLMMPGTFLLGAKYFQEIAPPDAVDRGENVAMGLSVVTPAGTFDHCVKVVDTNPAEEDQCGDEDFKIYCPGLGIVQDADLELVCYGFHCDDE